jgi:hypothetical protein
MLWLSEFRRLLHIGSAAVTASNLVIVGDAPNIAYAALIEIAYAALIEPSRQTSVEPDDAA